MENAFCKICRLGATNPEDLGIFTRVGKIYCHANCMYFSSGLTQELNIDNPRLGFNEREIRRLVASVSRKACVYCGQMGANITCAKKGCKRMYHFACGLPRNVTYQFHDSFNSYCHQHKVHLKKLNLPSKKYNAISERCVYCFEEITEKTNRFKYFRSQCCNGTYIHIKCAKLGALNAGAFTKCPGCNSSHSFIDQLLTIGVNVPHADATWEDNDNFADLYVPKRACVASKCICPCSDQKRSIMSNSGRNVSTVDAESLGRLRNDTDGYWKLVLCKLCGGCEVHRGCQDGDNAYQRWYKCKTCKTVEIAIQTKRKRMKRLSDGQSSRKMVKWTTFPRSSRVLRSRNC